VVREMAGEPHVGEAFKEDLRLLEQSVERCPSILGKLSAPADLSRQQMDISSPVEMAEIAASPYRQRGVDISVQGEGADPPPKCPRSPGCLLGLGNLIENAVNFAAKAVVILASWTKSMVRITILDDGRGFSPNVLARIGEPYLSQRDGVGGKLQAGGWDSACSSPVPCSSAPARRSSSATPFRRRGEPSSRSAGRAPPTRRSDGRNDSV
jgi:two-component system, sensor histidine kinase RegB